MVLDILNLVNAFRLITCATHLRNFSSFWPSLGKKWGFKKLVSGVCLLFSRKERGWV